MRSRVLEGAHQVTAVLGPTNTGKTHRAIAQMLQHRSGMIGLPLRLLAREVYDRVVAARGADTVALVTGEEKIIPKEPRYYVCTVEAMPVDRPVAFLCVDEIQLAGDRNRGHVFTDRLLHARGVLETMFLGSDTIAGLIETLIPSAKIERQPRLSRLAWAGCAKLSSVPRRSAVVAFSAEQVVAHAERLRSVHGGAAVVLGALSPRTRNAQVALYQAGEVQHIVATDAIGMGLNLDVRHVAFTGLRKFDGRAFRDLTSAELAQIAGRAGRYTTDGTFGTTREAGDLDPALAESIAHHSFPPLTRLFWRNTNLDVSSAAALLASLHRPPPHPALVQVRDEDDERALEELSRHPDLRLDHPEAVRIVWEVCQIPDYRKTLTGSHAALLHRIAAQLLATGRLDEGWVARRIDRLDQTDGDIDTLMARIAYVRTWTYVAFQRAWLTDATRWQERARQVEDRLSDALHERLVRRFVDQRRMLVTSAPSGALRVEGDVVRIGPVILGHLAGLDLSAELPTPLRQPLAEAVARRVDALAACEDTAIDLDDEHRFLWRGGVLGRLGPGPGLLEPTLRLARLDLLGSAEKEVVRRRLSEWLDRWIGRLLGPLRLSPDLRGPAKGLVYALEQGLGSAPRASVSVQVEALTKGDRAALSALDVRLGTETVYCARLLRPDAMALRARAYCVGLGIPLRPAPPDARASSPCAEVDRPFVEALGYRRFGGLAIRADVLERVAAQLRQWSRDGAAVNPEPLSSWMGCKRAQVAGVARDLGYRLVDAGDPRVRVVRRRR